MGRGVCRPMALALTLDKAAPYYATARMPTFMAARCSGVLPALAATMPIVSVRLGAAMGAPAFTSSFTTSH